MISDIPMRGKRSDYKTVSNYRKVEFHEYKKNMRNEKVKISSGDKLKSNAN